MVLIQSFPLLKQGYRTKSLRFGTGRREKNEFVTFSKDINMKWNANTSSSRILTLPTKSISFDDNHYTMHRLFLLSLFVCYLLKVLVLCIWQNRFWRYFDPFSLFCMGSKLQKELTSFVTVKQFKKKFFIVRKLCQSDFYSIFSIRTNKLNLSDVFCTECPLKWFWRKWSKQTIKQIKGKSLLAFCVWK